MKKKQILVVDDDKAIRSSLTLLLEHEGYAVTTAADPAEAIAVVRVSEPALVLLDMNFSRSTRGDEGLILLRQIKIFRPDTPVVLMTAWGSIPLAVEGMKRGASDFISKPWNNLALVELVAALVGSDADESGKIASGFDRSLIVGESRGINKVIDVLRRVSATDASVLIMGENGTGKELVAETIHRNSSRVGKPFVKVNLGGISQSLFESEMFGHRKGAFTDAIADRKGRFEIADGGTIFLDEIGELPLASQVKLLRVLQEHTFEPLGSSNTVKVDVRVVSATNARLSQMVADGTFREDLFYRLNLITVTLPPLRERAEDIDLLARHFSAGRADFTSDALDYLRSLQYPGNIRELKNLVERAILMCGETIDLRGLKRSVEYAPVTQPNLSSSSTVSNNEKKLVQDTLAACMGNISAAAAKLGITRQALYRRIEKYGIKI